MSCAATQILANGRCGRLTTRPEIDPPTAMTALIPLVLRPESTVTGADDCSVALPPYHWLPYLVRLQPLN